MNWPVIKDYFESEGETGIYGSKTAFRIAFRRGLIDEGQIWMDMIESRIMTVHTYDEEKALKVVEDIKQKYFKEFNNFRDKMQNLLDNAK
jgi:nucleotidyltransferase substrate binding protein (TIGR01987 family)